MAEALTTGHRLAALAQGVWRTVAYRFANAMWETVYSTAFANNS